MNEFIIAAMNLSLQLLPTLEVVVLVCLLVLLINITKIVKKLGNTIDKTDNTIDLVDKSIEKVQAPLDTVVKVSNTVEKVHDGTVEAVKAAKDYVVTNVNNVKEKFAKQEEVVDEKKEPSPEDIIKG